MMMDDRKRPAVIEGPIVRPATSFLGEGEVRGSLQQLEEGECDCLASHGEGDKLSRFGFIDLMC